MTDEIAYTDLDVDIGSTALIRVTYSSAMPSPNLVVRIVPCGLPPSGTYIEMNSTGVASGLKGPFL